MIIYYTLLQYHFGMVKNHAFLKIKNLNMFLRVYLLYTYKKNDIRTLIFPPKYPMPLALYIVRSTVFKSSQEIHGHFMTVYDSIG